MKRRNIATLAFLGVAFGASADDLSCESIPAVVPVIGNDERPITEHPTGWCWDEYPTGQASAADRSRCNHREWLRGWDNGTGRHCVNTYEFAEDMEVPCEPL